MTDLSEIYDIKPPFKLRVIPVGIPVLADVFDKNMSMSLTTIPPIAGIPVESFNHSLLGISSLKVGKHIGTLTVLAEDFNDFNHKRYEESCTCFENPQDMIATFSRRECEHLSFYKDEVIDCSNLFILIKSLTNIIENESSILGSFWFC